MKFVLQRLMLLALVFSSAVQAMQSTPERNKLFRELVREAIRSNDVHNLLRYFDVNYQDENGMTALHKAMDYYNVYVAEQLIDAGANSNINHRGGGTSFARAISLNNAALVKKMIDAGAYVNLKSGEYEWTPLHVAASNINIGSDSAQQKVTIINYLFQAGADVNEVNRNGDTVLHLAICARNRAALKAILQHSEINIWIKNKEGDTALDSAKKAKDHYPDCQQAQQIFRDLLLFSRTLKQITLEYIHSNSDQFTQEALVKLPSDLQEQLGN